MKPILCSLLLALTLINTACTTHKANSSSIKSQPIQGWGNAIDPSADCKFLVGEGELLISVPGTNGPHDLAAEIGITNAPRVLQTVEGDFIIEVVVDGRFSPGRDSTLPGRTAYNGAGLVLMADPNHGICLARAVLQYKTGKPLHYANFEMRTNGKVDGLGNAKQHPLPEKGPILLKLERRGQTVAGAFSSDGAQWLHFLQKTFQPAGLKSCKWG
ncbi:MAG: DUF1349 domain-containing protein [Limisphaerales bacterium]